MSWNLNQTFAKLIATSTPASRNSAKARRKMHSYDASRLSVAGDVELLEQRSMMSAVSAMPVVTAIPATDASISANGSSAHMTSAANPSVGNHSSLPSTSTFSFTASASSSSVVSLSWGSASGASGYLIDIWQNGAWKQIGNMSSGTTRVNVTGLSAGTTYYFDVGAYNSFGTNWGDYKAATTLSNQQPPTSMSLTGSVTSSSQVNLHWTGGAGATSFIVDEWVNGAWKPIGTVAGGSTGVNVTGLSANTTYYFCVGASNAAGTTWSSYVTLTTSAGGGGGGGTTFDHPTAGASYTVVSGSLFGSGGPKFTDVHQGNEGDCWLLAGLAATAARNPNDITSMFTSAGTAVENGQTVNLWKVRFYDNNGNAQYVTVDNELPQGGQYYDHVQGGVLWVALAEKAYAQANGKGYVTTQHVGQDAYDAMNGGWSDWAFKAITGKNTSNVGINTSNMISAWNNGQLICLGSSASANNNLIVGGSEGTHAYAVVGYSNGQFELYNPWGASSTVGGTVSAYGGTVYGGAFWASTSLISSDFNSQMLGTQLAFVSSNGAGSHSVSANGNNDLAISLPSTLSMESGGAVNQDAPKQGPTSDLQVAVNDNHSSQSNGFYATTSQGLDGLQVSFN